MIKMPDRPTVLRRLERGGAAAIVAIFLAGGVLLGLSALTIDVGSIWFERRQLQNGADAAAFSLLEECAEGTANCTDASPTTNTALVPYTSGNVHDSYASIDQVCGRGYVGLPACPAVAGDATTQLPECLPLPSSMTSGLGATLPYVQVKTGTSTNSGNSSTLLPGFFSHAITGSDNPHVVACARAVLGAPSSTGITFPLAMRQCDWDLATNGGTDFAPSPPYIPAGSPGTNPATAVPSSVEPYVTHVIAHATGNASTSCDVGLGASQYAPGGFGWLHDATDDCSAEYSAGVVGGDPGASPTGSCKDLMVNWLGKEVLIPIFTSVSGTGAGTEYTLSGVSAFYFAGWQDLPSAKPNKTYGVYKLPATLGGASTPVCQIPDDKGKYKDASCIWGWFTAPIVPVGSANPSIPGYGPTTPGLVG